MTKEPTPSSPASGDTTTRPVSALERTVREKAEWMDKWGDDRCTSHILELAALVAEDYAQLYALVKELEQLARRPHMDSVDAAYAHASKVNASRIRAILEGKTE
jgi:hypothetical protein